LKEGWPSGVPAEVGESGKMERSGPQAVCVVAECVPMGMSGREGGRLFLSLLDETGTFRSGMRVCLRVEEGRLNSSRLGPCDSLGTEFRQRNACKFQSISKAHRLRS
jgi:hypothetical protein